MTDAVRYNYILSVLPKDVSAAIRKSEGLIAELEEVRIRREMPVSVTRRGKSLFLVSSGGISQVPDSAVYCHEKDFHDTLLKICENSVFAHTKEIENGYISMPGGIRAGVCGDFSSDISGISSINLRIPRQVLGCADREYSAFSGGMLLSGPPGCGKTTKLRELIRKLSYSGYRISVVDSRREISGGTGQLSFDLGPNTDVMFLADKAKGAGIALRTMYPQIIAFDEIGTEAEIRSVLEAFNSGVFILTTAHAKTIKELKLRPVTRSLICADILKTVVLIPCNIGAEPQIYDIEEIKSETDN